MQIEGLGRVSTKAVATLFGVSHVAVSRWHSKAGCPRNGDGTYDLGAVIRWKLQRIQEESVTAKAASSSPALERKRMLENEIKEIELAKLRGQLISIADVEQGRVQRIREVKRSLLAVPRAVAPRLAGKEDRHEIEQILTAKLKAVCDQFARQ
jgi:phage terminase Nu1 subunit (DNA packaging protein)